MKNPNTQITVRPVDVQVRELLALVYRTSPRRVSGVLVPPRDGSV